MTAPHGNQTKLRSTLGASGFISKSSAGMERGGGGALVTDVTSPLGGAQLVKIVRNALPSATVS